MLEQPGAPRADGHAVWVLLKSSFANWFNANTPRLGAALAYYTVLSLAPLLIVVVGIAGMVFGRQAAEGQIVWQIEGLVGHRAAEAVQGMVRQAFAPEAGLVAAIVGVVVLLFGASGVFMELRGSLNTVWGVETSGSLWALIRERFFSFAMVLAIGFLLLVSLVVSTALAAAGKFLGAWLPVSAPLLELANLALSFVVTTVLFALLYKVVPEAPIAWRDVWIGAAVTALLFSVGKLVIGLYLGRASIGSAYGAAGSVVVILVWVYYSAQVFFLGAGFTRAFAERHGSRAPAAWGGNVKGPRAA